MRIKSCCSIILYIAFAIIIGCGDDDDDDNREDIRIGMTATEVIRILGSPAQIESFEGLGTLYAYGNLSVWIDPRTQRVIAIIIPTLESTF